MADAGRIVIDNTLGAAYIGVVVAGALYGVTCVQTWFYFDRYGADPWFLKALVALVWVFDTVHQALISHTVYTYVVTNFSNPSFLLHLEWSVIVEVIFTAFITFIVQSFLSYRVWRLSTGSVRLPLMVILIGLVVAEFGTIDLRSAIGVIILPATGCALSYGIKGLLLRPATVANLSHMKGVTETIVVAVAGDVVIAGALCLFLHRSRTGFKKSNTMITKLILFAVSAGVLTSICCIACLIAILVWPSTLIYVGFYFLLGKLYTNSLLATLNARQYIRRLGEDSGPESFNLHPSQTLFSNIKFDSNPTNADSSVKMDKHPRVSESA